VQADFGGLGYSPVGKSDTSLPDIIYQIGLWCNNASLIQQKDRLWNIIGDPTEGALLVVAHKAQVTHTLSRIDEIPFDSVRKMMSVLVQDGERMIMATKGSVDHVLTECTHFLDSTGTVQELSDTIRQDIMKQNSLFSSQAFRVLAGAYKAINDVSEFTEKQLI